jgi:hypothetical protein
MVFTKHLREGVRRGRIRCSVRIWTRPHVKVGGRYPMDEGQIVVDSLVSMSLADITDDLARESGFSDVKNLLQTAKHGSGDNVYLIRFHYLPPGAWDVPLGTSAVEEHRDEGRTKSGRRSSALKKPTLLQRIRTSTPGALPKEGKGGPTTRWSRRRRG